MRNLIIALICALSLGVTAVNIDAAQQKQKKPSVTQKKGGNKGTGQKKGGKGRPTDPAQLAARMIARFDRNGDKALNAQELTAALRALRSQRGNQSPGKGKGPAGKGKSPKGK